MSVELELTTAKQDVFNTCIERGQGVVFHVRAEGDVTRDTYNSIVARAAATQFTIYCYPILPAPTERELVRAGIKFMCDVLLYAPKLAFDNAGLTWQQLDTIRSTIVVDGQTYRIKEKARNSQFAGDWLYITFGLALTG